MRKLKEFSKKDACDFLHKHDFSPTNASRDFIKLFQLKDDLYNKVLWQFTKVLPMAEDFRRQNRKKKKKYNPEDLACCFFKYDLEEAEEENRIIFMDKKCDNALAIIYEIAENMGISPLEVLSFLGHKISHEKKCKNLKSKFSCTYAKCGADGKFGPNLDKVLSIKNKLNLSKQKYIDLKLSISEVNQFPTYQKLAKHHSSITPKMHLSINPAPGIRFTYREAIACHMERLNKFVPLDPVEYELCVKGNVYYFDKMQLIFENIDIEVL